MTLAEVQESVWQELPSVRRHLVGRRLVDRIVSRAVRGWPVPVLEQCDAGEADIVGTHMARSLERAVRQEVGMGIILTLVLSAVISEIVKALIRRWMENRQAMRQLVGEVRHD